MTANDVSSFACGAPARWLPRALGGSVLAAGILAAGRVGSQSSAGGAQGFRLLLLMAAAAAALWIVRKGGEVRVRVSVEAEGIVFEVGSHRVSLEFERIEALRYEAPFGPSRSWLPAAVVVERGGREWRLSALLTAGDVLIDTLVNRSGREDLVAWAEAHGIRDKMSRSSLRLRIGYAFALAVVILAALYSLS